MIVTLLIIHAFVTVAMIGLILLQKSDGSGPLGIGGGNNALFTARGVANILTRATAVLASLFIGNCVLIGILTNRDLKDHSFLFSQPVKATQKTMDRKTPPLETPMPVTKKTEPADLQKTQKTEAAKAAALSNEKSKTSSDEVSKKEELASGPAYSTSSSTQEVEKHDQTPEPIEE